MKRQNFNVTPEQESELLWLQEAISAATAKDTVLRSVRVLSLLVREVRAGRRIYARGPSGEMERLVIPELEAPEQSEWTYLAQRQHPWRKQLYVKGRRLKAATVWSDMIANNQSREAAADDWDLPVEAIDEIVRYCESNEELIKMESLEERLRAKQAGLEIGA